MSVNGKIDTTDDFTSNGLMQLKLWLDPWFRNKAKGAGLPVPPWTVDYDTGEVTGTTYPPSGPDPTPTVLQLHAETTDSTTLDALLELLVVAADAQTLAGILGDWTVGEDVSLAANEVRLLGEGNVTAVAYKADMAVGDSGDLLGCDFDAMVGGEGSNVTGFRTEIDVADFGLGRGADLDVQAVATGGAVGVKVRTRAVDGFSTGLQVEATVSGAGTARSIVATGVAEFNNPVMLNQQAEFAASGSSTPFDPSFGRVYNVDNGDGSFDLCCDVNGGDVVVLATG